MDFYKLNKDISIEIKKKKIKNFNLRVLSNGVVTCSVPDNVEEKDVMAFLHKKSSWIIQKVEKYKKLQNVKSIDILKNGGSVQLLGRHYRINIKQSQNFYIEFDDLTINIYCKDKENLEFIQQEYNSYIKQKMYTFFSDVLDRLYPVVRSYHIAKPELKIRKMQSCWGNCNRSKQIITMNEFLYKASPLCIEYIVLHELSHLIYPYHDKNFYNFIELHMPDWKERKKLLNSYYSV